MSRKPVIDTESVAQDQIRAFVERIMRMREEARAINDDIREIYAEAKGNGFDKTVLGKIVLYVEKRGKDANAVAEKDALFDLYLEAFDGDASRTHAHEADDDDTNSATPGGPVDGAEPETSLAPVSSTTQSTAARMDVQRQDGADHSRSHEPTRQPGSDPAGTQAPPVDTIRPRTAAENALMIRPWCLHADDLRQCGGQGHKHCFGCLKAHADAEGIAA